MKEELKQMALKEIESSECMIPACKIPIQEKARAILALIESYEELLDALKAIDDCSAQDDSQWVTKVLTITQQAIAKHKGDV